jgi:glycosyltransferase involved in cell wall biosynthesis
MESDYLWSYRTARLKGCSRKGALRRALLRRRYIGHLKTMGRRAHQLFAISDYTKRDFVKYTRTSEAKIQITYLGIDESLPAKSTEGTTFTQYMESSWGQLPQAVDLIEKPFLLFLGGADPRRKLIDLFAAYNNLKARGYDIRLVLAGDTMKGRRSLPTSELQNYLANESYISDIAFLGFVDDTQREWLFDHALAMVYPSVYEGFGLPVLEAMRYGTPVITYNNSSIKEIAGDAAIFAHDSISIFKSVEMLLLKPGKRASYSARGKAQASKFSWSKTVTVIVSHISS